MTADPDLDSLLERLRDRAADPARRTSVRPTRLARDVQALDLGGLLSMAGGLSAALRNVVAANQAGRVDAEGAALADDLRRRNETPVDDPLPAPASDDAIAAAEAALGARLPPALRRVYAEVADGGFGPGQGLLPLAEVVEEYRELRTPGLLPRGRAWPVGLLPVVAMDPGWDCVDAATGAVIAWDPEDLTEHASEERFRRSFAPAHESVEAWLGAWIGEPTHEEQRAAMMASLMAPDAQVRQAQQAREAIGRMSLEERRAMGLPDTGWERVVWGGIGWTDDEPAPGEGQPDR